MPRFSYVVIITGEVEAPAVDHAAMQVKMGISLTARLLASPNNVQITVQDQDMLETEIDDLMAGMREKPPEGD